jgi:hypothetical protein
MKNTSAVPPSWFIPASVATLFHRGAHVREDAAQIRDVIHRARPFAGAPRRRVPERLAGHVASALRHDQDEPTLHDRSAPQPEAIQENLGRRRVRVQREQERRCSAAIVLRSRDEAIGSLRGRFDPSLFHDAALFSCESPPHPGDRRHPPHDAQRLHQEAESAIDECHRRLGISAPRRSTLR